MTLHRRRIQAMTSLTLADVSTAADAEVADTVKRAISELSERMRVISLPSHRRDTSFVVRETTGHTERPKSPLVRRECQWSLLHSV